MFLNPKFEGESSIQILWNEERPVYIQDRLLKKLFSEIRESSKQTKTSCWTKYALFFFRRIKLWSGPKGKQKEWQMAMLTYKVFWNCYGFEFFNNERRAMPPHFFLQGLKSILLLTTMFCVLLLSHEIIK